MGEIIQLREFASARRRTSRAIAQRSLAAALDRIRESLCATAEQLRAAPAADQPELLRRIENLADLVRYGLRLTDDSPNAERDEPEKGLSN